MKLTFGIAILALLAISVTSAGRRLRRLNAKIDALTKAVEQLSQQKGHDPFRKLNTAPVCFGAKDNQFGTFKVPSGGNIRKMKLVHLYGYVSCLAGGVNYWSPWGCGLFGTVINYVGVSITTVANTVLLPPKELSLDSGWSFVAGYNSQSPELVLTRFSDDPIAVTAGQELRLWYSEDLFDANNFDHNNGGRACCDVYAIFE
ncbi:uncharacterized protein LOC144651056 [Oculina patagonica]